MAGGLQKERAAGSLKEAVAELVSACGGHVECAEAEGVRVSKSQIARYTDESDESAAVHMPADIILTLERLCGQPLVTRFLAGVQGYALVELSAEGRPSHPVTLSNIGRESGELFADAADALSDGTVSLREAGRLRRDALELMTACEPLVADC